MTEEINRAELKTLIAGNIVDSAEAADMLGCSRQNIDDLVKRGKLEPIYASSKARLFLRADILARIEQKK